MNLKLLVTHFTMMFRFLKTFEGGWAHQTNGHRAFESVLGITVLLYINGLVFFPSFSNAVHSYIFIVSFSAGWLFFIPRKRYMKFIDDQKSYKNRNLLNGISIIYSIGTLLSMLYVIWK